MKLVILDSNAYWTEQLFLQCGRFSEVLLLKPRDMRAHALLSGRILSDRSPVLVSKSVWAQRVSMPPGWMFQLWPVCKRKLAKCIRDFVRRDPYTFVVTFPQYRELIRDLRPPRSIYYCFDDYRDNWPAYRNRLPAWERQLVEWADATVCISRYRAETLKRAVHGKAEVIHHIPIGCTRDLIAGEVESRGGSLSKGQSKQPESIEVDARGAWPENPARSRADEPRNTWLSALHEFAHVGTPIVGHVGALNRRFDFALFAEVAAMLPQVAFLLAGRAPDVLDGDSEWRNGLARARGLKNVRFVGWVEHRDLRIYLESCDALLMMYAKSEFNLSACPAKLWDYLGSGRPIVSNDVNPETLLWGHVVCIRSGAEDLANALAASIASDDECARAGRLAVARAHTYEALSRRLEPVVKLRSQR